WTRIQVVSGATATLNYAIVKYGGCGGLSCNSGNGSVLYTNGGTLNLLHSTISSNGVALNYTGAIKAESGGTLTISDSTISNNISYEDFAGIRVNNASLSVSNSTISNQRYGVYVQVSTALTVSGNTFSNGVYGLYLGGVAAPT